MKKIMFFLFAISVTSLAIAETLWIDVRSTEEYNQDHINGDIRISYEEIIPNVVKLIPDKNAEIHLYCKSGRRAGIAMLKLKEAGYKNVANAGGISDARKERELNNK